MVPVGLTDAHGNAALSVPLSSAPSMVGATFLLQWITVAGSGSGCGTGLAFSNGLQVQIQ